MLKCSVRDLPPILIEQYPRCLMGAVILFYCLGFKLVNPTPFTDVGFGILFSNYNVDATIAPVNVIDPLNVTAASISPVCSIDAMYPSAV
jgi:hypothetical protein